MNSSFAPYDDLTLIPGTMQILVEQIFREGLELACLSDMDGVLTKNPYRYACPVLDQRIIGPLARANRQTANGRPLLRLAIVSARDVQAQLAIPGMPKNIFHFGGLGTRHFDPIRGQIIYTGDPEEASLCQQVMNKLVSRLLTAGRGKFSKIYWDYRFPAGVNLVLEELSEPLQWEVIKICQEIALELNLNSESKLLFEYRVGGKEPNCDFLSKRMIEIGKGSAVEDFLKEFPRAGFLLMQEDTERWLNTFVQAAQAALEKDILKKGYCAVLVTPSQNEFEAKQTSPSSWWITLSSQSVLARFINQYVTLLERLAALTV